MISVLLSLAELQKSKLTNHCALVLELKPVNTVFSEAFLHFFFPKVSFTDRVSAGEGDIQWTDQSSTAKILPCCTFGEPLVLSAMDLDQYSEYSVMELHRTTKMPVLIVLLSHVKKSNSGLRQWTSVKGKTCFGCTCCQRMLYNTHSSVLGMPRACACTEHPAQKATERRELVSLGQSFLQPCWLLFSH